ncbi:MAG: 3-deoxy-manno-octulosonate cytidylyltransferase [Verrucomicrobiae bacterium]|nr:3-deoxy-manno-octulosonate cytidylyltransferase [Verrucomicrobiae bacterium]
MKTLGVIPARYGAQRFPGKPLALIAGKPLVQHVYERARKARRLDAVVVATDDERIARAVGEFGGEAVMTPAECPSGTDRVALVAAQRECDLVVNIQGDEPLMRPEMIDQLVDGIAADPHCPMATLARRIESPDLLANPNVVKVVFAHNGHALYFSRHPIPYVRDAGTRAQHYKHLGIYGYRREFLLTFVRLAPTPLEKTEKLEQLRALEHGFAIKVLFTPYDSVGVDTPEDVAVVERILEQSQ